MQISDFIVSLHCFKSFGMSCWMISWPISPPCLYTLAISSPMLDLYCPTLCLSWSMSLKFRVIISCSILRWMGVQWNWFRHLVLLSWSFFPRNLMHVLLSFLCHSVHPFVTKLVHLLLRRDPARRPSASEAVAMAVLLLFGPNAWLNSNLYGAVTKEDIDT